MNERIISIPWSKGAQARSASEIALYETIELNLGPLRKHMSQFESSALNRFRVIQSHRSTITPYLLLLEHFSLGKQIRKMTDFVLNVFEAATEKIIHQVYIGRVDRIMVD